MQLLVLKTFQNVGQEICNESTIAGNFEDQQSQFDLLSLKI